MDLVSAYDSDGSEKGEPSANDPPKTKEIDVIELDDSESDIQDSPEKNAPGMSAKFSDKKQLDSSKENNSTVTRVIECIDIDQSSGDEDEVSTEKIIPSENLPAVNIDETLPTVAIQILNSQNDDNSHKVDYLNLNASDSEEEQVVSEKVNKILESAAILNDLPSGPENFDAENTASSGSFLAPFKQVESSLHSFILPAQDNNTNSSQCDNKIKSTENHYPIQEKTALPDSSANKRFRRDSETPKSTVSVTNADVVENTDLPVHTSYMYRKDERISTAFAKNVVCRLPRQVTKTLVSHVNTVTALQWCIPQYSHLLLSASADCTVKVWDMFCRQPVRSIKDNFSLKAAKWSLSGEQIITGGYGKKARVFDVLSGKEIVSYDMFHYLNSIEVHPYMDDIFLCGTRNAIFGFDLRVNSNLPIRTFLSKCEEVLDIVFIDENEFVCSTSVVSHDSADRTVMVWDFSTGAIMSNQIYLERYTCPSLKLHPHDSCFIAQTNGDYIAAFSSQKPYKIKDRRYMGHKVSGFGIECDISPDGKYIASGDATGDLYFYSYAHNNMINKLAVKPNTPINRLKWHPAFNSMLATSTWDGHIQIWK